MNRIDRLFGILTLLQSRKFVPAEKIAERFDISIRTVYRDIKALCEQGVPVSFEQHKGYFIVQGFFLPPVSFTSEEANALLLVEAFAHGFADKSIRTHYSTALNKIKAVLRGRQKESVEFLNNNIKFQFPACVVSESENLSLLQESISSRTIIEMEYVNSGKTVSSRMVEPIGLIFYAFNWHLIGWCHKRMEYRDFKISRILKVQSTAQPFTRQDHIPLAEYMKELPVSY